MTFNDLGLEESLLTAIQDLGFEYPTPIQEKTIPRILESSDDLICLAQTGSGKTAAFGLPILQKLELGKGKPQALVLAPTRELAMQIHSELGLYAKKKGKIGMVCVYGGASYGAQKSAINAKPELVVATPGRLLDLADRGSIDLSEVKFLILDEADTMLNMGFREELDRILDMLPKEKQVLLFSATMPSWIGNLAKSSLRNPQEITVGDKNAGASSVEHRYYLIQARDKEESLRRILDNHPDIYGLVFVRTRVAAKGIAEHLSKAGYNADALHGDLSQDQREYVTRRFREGSVQILVATDIAARGLDVKNLSHVIHYDLPDDRETFTHRSGRTGRAGATGQSLALVNLREKMKIKNLERTLGLPIKKDIIPSGEEVCKAQVKHLVKKLKTTPIDYDNGEPLYRLVRNELLDMEKEEFLVRWVSLEFQTLFSTYSKAPDLNPQDRPRERQERERPGSRRENRDRDTGDMVWVTINLGRSDSFMPPDLLGLVGRSFPGKRIEIGRIKINDISTNFEVRPEDAVILENSLKRKDAFGKRLKVKMAGSAYDQGFGSENNRGSFKGKPKGKGGGNFPKDKFRKDKRKG